ncbi:hypothetical protein V2J09_008547 [Rumex salicifolius]
MVLLLGVIGVGGTVYKVGDNSGWTIGVDYSTWASSNTFVSDYSTCTIGNAITTDSSGATTFPLKSPGRLFFICGVVGHCSSGMKLSVTVAGVSSSTAPPSVPTTTTTNATTTTTGSVPCTTPSPNVYGIPMGTTPLSISESPKILSSLPAAALAFAGGVLVFQMMILR